MNKYWSNIVQSLTPYEAGEQLNDRTYIKLNTNENPYPPSPKVLASIQERVNGSLRLYPDPESITAKQAIADHFSLRSSNVFVGNGSDEVLAFSFLAFYRDKPDLVFPDISYTFYPVYCRLFDIQYTTFPLSSEFEIDINTVPRQSGGIIIANPNTPTGTFLAIDKIDELLKRNPDVVILIDEAYIDFGGQSCIPLINKYKNLLVVQTLSKSRSLAGMRIGFALGDTGLIDGLNKVKNSFNAYPIDSLATTGVIEAIKDDEYFKQCRKAIIDTREWTVKELEQLSFNVVPSMANYIFITHRQKNAKSLYVELKDKGVLVRYFDMPDIDNYLRVSIGTMEDMKIFIDTTRSIVE